MARLAGFRMRRKPPKHQTAPSTTLGPLSSAEEVELPQTDEDDTTKTSSTAEYAHSPLLRLPAELRNHIYITSLVRDDPFEIDNFCARQFTCANWHHRGRSTCLSTVWTAGSGPGAIVQRSPIHILRANRQIHREATAIFYGVNTFELSSTTAGPFLSMIGRSLHHLRSVIMSRLETSQALDALIHFLPPKLEKICIRACTLAVSISGPERWSALAAPVVNRFVRDVSGRKHRDQEDILAWFHATQRPLGGFAKTPPEYGFDVYTDAALNIELKREIHRLMA